jgi:hypothetical protein
VLSVPPTGVLETVDMVCWTAWSAKAHMWIDFSGKLGSRGLEPREKAWLAKVEHWMAVPQA